MWLPNGKSVIINKTKNKKPSTTSMLVNKTNNKKNQYHKHVCVKIRRQCRRYTSGHWQWQCTSYVTSHMNPHTIYSTHTSHVEHVSNRTSCSNGTVSVVWTGKHQAQYNGKGVIYILYIQSTLFSVHFFHHNGDSIAYPNKVSHTT